MALQHHEDLCIWMLMQFGTIAGGSVHPEKRNGNASMLSSLKQMVRKLLSRNDVLHVFSPFHSSDVAGLYSHNIVCLKIGDGGNDLTTDDFEWRCKLRSPIRHEFRFWLGALCWLIERGLAHAQ